MVDLLAWQAGKLTVDQIRDVSPALRTSLARARISPASRRSKRQLVSVSPAVVAGDTAQVTATVRVVDEGFVYDVALSLRHTPEGWVVTKTR